MKYENYASMLKPVEDYAASRELSYRRQPDMIRIEGIISVEIDDNGRFVLKTVWGGTVVSKTQVEAVSVIGSLADALASKASDNGKAAVHRTLSAIIEERLNEIRARQAQCSGNL